MSYVVTPSYDDSTLTTTLALGGVATGLPTGQLYRLRIVGTGGSPLKDLAGNALQGGTDTT